MYGESVAPGSSTVEVDLLADGDATIVRVRHRELRPEVRSFHDMGWAHYLPRLAVAAAAEIQASTSGPRRFARSFAFHDA
jgi:hypothetical protein